MADERSQETHEFLDCGPAGCGRIHCRHDGGVDDIGIQVNPKPTRFVPHAALRDPALYELLALVDAIRDGRARERNLAERVLVRRLKASHGES
jgi:hypothetical protein